MPAVDELEIRARVGEILNRRPAVGLAIGVVRDGRLEFFHAHGVADIASNTPVTEDTVFRIASITKTFTAIAVMQLCEQGLVDLDAPADDYLRAYRLVPANAGWRPATVRHLLTHTAGIAEVVHPRTPVHAGLRRNGGRRAAPARARGVLPRRPAPVGRAGHQVHLRQPRPRHPGPARRGRERQALGPLPS